jgi:hypothetical protein
LDRSETEWRRELSAWHARLGELFIRPAPRWQAGLSLEGLLSAMERKKGWQLAEHLGDARPWQPGPGSPALSTQSFISESPSVSAVIKGYARVWPGMSWRVARLAAVFLAGVVAVPP